MKLFALIVITAVLFSCGKNPPATDAKHTFWHPLPSDVPISAPVVDRKKACDDFRLALPAEYEIGQITVPENWSLPSGRQIDVFYYWNRNAAKIRVPIVFFNGGPTYESHGTFLSMKAKLKETDLPFVFLDQRGTGCSTAYPADLTEENAVRLSHYGSANVVRDAEKVRETLLGARKKWKAYGQSAGGWMVQRYIELAPQNLHAAFAHGSAIGQDAVQEFYFRIASQKRVAEKYFQKFPDDREILAKARTRVPETLCFNNGTSRICGNGVLDALVIPLAFQGSWASVHEWIAASAVGETGAFLDWVKQVAENFFFTGYLSPNGFAGSVITLVETSLVDEEQICKSVESRFRKEGVELSALPFNECRLVLGMEQKWNDLMGAVTLREPYNIASVAKRLEEFPGLPFYLYAGELDPLVPVEAYAHTLATLKGRVTYEAFPTSGHEGFYTEPKIWTDLETH